MAKINELRVVGRLTKDPEVFFNGDMAKFTIAVYGGQNEAGDKYSYFFTVKAYKALATDIAKNLRKGDEVLVFGYLTQNRFKDKNTGVMRSAIEIAAATVMRAIPLQVKCTIEKPEKAEEEPTMQSSGLEQIDMADGELPF